MPGSYLSIRFSNSLYDRHNFFYQQQNTIEFFTHIFQIARENQIVLKFRKIYLFVWMRKWDKNNMAFFFTSIELKTKRKIPIIKGFDVK